MLPRTETSETIANHWLARFEKALAEPDDILLETLFHPDSHWRDVLALTWHIRTVSGLDAILRALKAHVARANPSDFRTDPHRTAPRHVTRAGTNAFEAIFRFETDEGRGSGVLFARFPRAQLARPQKIRRRVCREGSGCAGRRRGTGGAFDRGAPDSIAGRYADRGP